MSRMPGFALPANVTATVEKWQTRARAMRASLGDEAPQRDWYRITNQADSDEAEVMLYDEIGGWFGSTADQFIADLRGVTAPNLRVRVNSPGGSVFEGIAIANALRSHPANVTVQVDGIAASIASVIAMAGDRVEMAPNTMLMIHDASGLCMGDASDMEEMAELLDLISDNIADAYSAKAGGTRDQWRARMQAETWYLPEDAVEAGLADEATKSPKAGAPAADPDENEPEPEMRRAFDLSAYGYTPPPAAGGVVANPPVVGEDDTDCTLPKPTPPPAPQPEQSATLTFPIGSTLGEQLVEVLRASVRARQDAQPEAVVPEIVGTACPVHHTATEDRPWDSGPNEKRLPSPMTLKTARGMYAWYDEDQAENGELPKSACSLPHHEVSADGTPGAANLSGVRNALARLPQSSIPASQHDAVRRHLQAHLDDAKGADDTADIEPAATAEPEAPAAEPDGWGVLTAHLTEPDPDPWAALVSHLTTTTTSPSAANA